MLNNNQTVNIKTKICQALQRKRNALIILNDDIDQDYSRGRTEQDVTKIVYDAFRPEGEQIDGLTIEKCFYGRNMALPQFSDGVNIFQLYNHTANPYGTNEVVEFGQRFHILEFRIEEKALELKNLDLISFSGLTENHRAKIKERRAL